MLGIRKIVHNNSYRKKNKPNRTKATIKVTIKRMESKTWGHEIKSSSHSGEY